jgi:hypothetical protein
MELAKRDCPWKKAILKHSARGECLKSHQMHLQEVVNLEKKVFFHKFY